MDSKFNYHGEFYANARIINMDIEKINKYLESGIAIIPGFQGVSKNGDITTIGRGGLMQQQLL